MVSIFKYPLQVTDTQRLEIPGLIKVLHVEAIQNVPCLWCLIDVDKDYAGYTVLTVGTGHKAEQVVDALYIGTYQLYGGQFIGHVFIK